MQTDNSEFDAKVYLRLKMLPENPSVLDCFAGKRRLWNIISAKTGIKYYYPIEKKEGLDNLKLLDVLDLSKFNVIDLDSYGFPVYQLEKYF